MEFSGQYLTYQEYRQLGGTLDIMPFNLLEFEIRKIIDKRTQRRLIGIEERPQELKLCVYKLIDKTNEYIKENNNKNISSETIDGYSVNYISGNEAREVINTKHKEYEDIIVDYLINVVVNNTSVVWLGVE